MKTLVTALTLGTLIAASALVQSASAAPPSDRLDAARAQAIQECSAAAQKYSQSTWGHFQIDQYRSCMAQHGQQE